MKRLASGELRLAGNERRIGNFIIKNADDYIQMYDLGSVFCVKVKKTMPIGVWLHNVWKQGEKGNDTIKTYIATMWSVLAVAPDNDFIQNLLDVTKDCLERHPDWYGMDKVSDEEDAKIIQEEKELNEFIEKVKEIPDDAEVSDGEQKS